MKKWTEQDDIKLLIELNNGKNLIDIARDFKVTYDVLRAHFKNLKVKYGDIIIQKHGESIIDGFDLTAFTGALQSLPPLTKPEIYKMDTRKDTEIAQLSLSDIHVGQLASKELTGGLGEYNWTQCLDRADRLKKGVMKIVELRRKATNINKLVIMLGGDIVEGHGIFKTQQYEVEFDVMEQVLKAITLVSDIIVYFAQNFEHVTVVGVPGNHGVLGGRKETPFHINFDSLIYKLLEKYLVNQKNVKFDFSTTWYQLVDIEGWKELLIHGDDIGGSVMSDTKVQGIWGKYQKMLNSVFQYMLIGHFHQQWSIPYGFGGMYINGGWTGANAFSKVVKNAAVPVQWLTFIHKNWGIVSPSPIYLIQKEARTPDIKTIKM